MWVRSSVLSFLLGLCPLALAHAEQPGASPARPMLDNYPSRILDRLASQASAQLAVQRELGNSQARFIFGQNHWTPGSKILVAFRGGTADLHRAIAETAREWERYGNFTLDFGRDKKTGLYRSWSPSDKFRVAHIRIDFSETGYWSYIGTDSVGEAPIESPTMTFEGFADRWPNLMPEDWRATVL